MCLLLQVIVTTPMEMLKIQLQDAGRIGKNICRKEEGVKGEGRDQDRKEE